MDSFFCDQSVDNPLGGKFRCIGCLKLMSGEIVQLCCCGARICRTCLVGVCPNSECASPTNVTKVLKFLMPYI